MNGTHSRLALIPAALGAAAILAGVALSATPSQVSVYGNYVATLSRAGLDASGIDTGNVGGTGVWHLSITRRWLTFRPPPPYPATTYPLVGVSADRITLGPEQACSTKFGRTHKSVFNLVRTAIGLRFVKVVVACSEDGGALAVAPWRKR
jgi:hypothetical protein